MPPIPKTCIVCGSEPRPYVANGLPVWRCQNCSLMWRQSFDVPISYYEKGPGGFSKEKEKLQRRNIRDRIRTIARYVNLDSTCDVGGSKGYFVEELIRGGYRNVLGVDPNKIQVNEAQRRGVPMLTGSTENILEIFQQKRIKNATLFHVVEHLPDPQGAIRQIYDALPAGGFLVIETPDFGSDPFRKLKYKHKLVYKEHLFYFTRDNLQKFLVRMGFTIVYAGQRDFDQYHLNARESLFRLNLMSKSGDLSLSQKIILRLSESFLVLPLSLAVRFLGRGSLVLAIGQKP